MAPVRAPVSALTTMPRTCQSGKSAYSFQPIVAAVGLSGLGSLSGLEGFGSVAILALGSRGTGRQRTDRTARLRCAAIAARYPPDRKSTISSMRPLATS